MAYSTGSAADLAALLSAIQSACTSNGWTLSGSVLSKDGCYVALAVSGSTLTIRGGNGIDGSNNLTGAGPAVARLRAFSQAFVFPMTYEIHVNADPDEVYVFVSYNVSFFQWLAWGKSDAVGLTGTGNWYGAIQSAVDVSSLAIGPTSIASNSTAGSAPALFECGSPGNNVQNSFIHHDLDSGGWNALSGSIQPLAWTSTGLLQTLLPNAWNTETVLIPIQVWVPRSSGNKVSLVADLKHARYCRIDFHDPGEIITLGTDQWKLYPWYQKNATTRDGGSGVQHSGTFGVAVRYTA